MDYGGLWPHSLRYMKSVRTIILYSKLPWAGFEGKVNCFCSNNLTIRELMWLYSLPAQTLLSLPFSLFSCRSAWQTHMFGSFHDRFFSHVPAVKRMGKPHKQWKMPIVSLSKRELFYQSVDPWLRHANNFLQEWTTFHSVYSGPMW